MKIKYPRQIWYPRYQIASELEKKKVIRIFPITIQFIDFLETARKKVVYTKEFFIQIPISRTTNIMPSHKRRFTHIKRKFENLMKSILSIVQTESHPYLIAMSIPDKSPVTKILLTLYSDILQTATEKALASKRR